MLWSHRTLDDAVFSVAEHMLSRPDDEFTIITPCGMVPMEEPDRSKYDRILTEHNEAMERGGWDWIGGDFADDGARARGNGNWMKDIREHLVLQDWLIDVLQERVKGGEPNVFRDRFDEWWIPLGIHHPDHLAVARAMRHIGRPTARWRVYEELPYRVLWPQTVWADQSMILIGPGPEGPQFEAKRRLCQTYASQYGETEERCLYAPERLWGPK